MFGGAQLVKQAWRTLGIKEEWLGWGGDLEHTCITESYAFQHFKSS